MAKVEAVFPNNEMVSIAPITKFSSSSIILKNDEVELMQFTGYKDKKGKEIYEGDICQETHESGTFVWVVKWNGAGMEFESVSKNLHIGIHTQYTEMVIIGNIYENPELIK